MSTAENDTAKRTREDRLGPIKQEMQLALFTALTTNNLALLDQTVRKLVVADPIRTRVAFQEVLEPVRQNANVKGGPVADLLNSLAAIEQIAVATMNPRIRPKDVFRVGNRRTVLIFPNAPGLEDIAAVRMSTIKAPNGKTMIMLEPFTKVQHEAIVREHEAALTTGIASVLPQAA